jgi:hypothetical protein
MSAVAPVVRIRVRDVPAHAGLAWIRSGFRAFGRQPGGFMGLFALFMLLMLVASVPLAVLVPVAEAVGLGAGAVQFVGIALLPLLSLAFMVGTEAAMNDLRVTPAMLFVPLNRDAPGRGALLAIGVAYALLFVVAAFAGDWIDGGELRRLLAHPPLINTPADLEAVPALARSSMIVLQIKVAVVALGSIPLWHAPALARWGRQPALRAMFGSVVALWRTRAAFAVFLVGWSFVWITGSLALGLVGAILGGGWLALLVILSGLWALTAVFYVTLWFGFVDTFEIRTPPADAASGK